MTDLLDGSFGSEKHAQINYYIYSHNNHNLDRDLQTIMSSEKTFQNRSTCCAAFCALS